MEDGAEEHDDRIPAADRVLRLLKVVEEPFEVVLLDELHALVVHLADELVHRHVLLVRLVVEMIAPVAEITGDDEDGILVIEVL